jgi:arginine decarboxylase
LPAEAPTWGTTFFPTLGAVLRDGFNTPNEHYLNFISHVDSWHNLDIWTPDVGILAAWYAYGKFHPIYKHRFAMGVPQDMKNRPTVISVQSTHKMLPAFSMASYIHVSNSERGKMAWSPIKEAFMMHGTTSPFYPLIASIDIASAMMDEPTGPVLLRETIRYAVDFRKAIASVAHRYKKNDDWFFNVFQPDKVRIGNKSVDFHKAPTEILCTDAACWTMRSDETWHGLPDDVVADDFAMLDPTKVTILCPGTDAHGKIAKRGIPGAILTKFLDARRQAIARTGTTPCSSCSRLAPRRASRAR